MNNSPPTSANNNAPVQLGHYQLRDCIGRGGMGLVYRARDTRLERDVAIKCLRTELFEAHYIERFKREALLLAKLNHPNIVQIYDFIEAPEQVALVMELVDGQNLQSYLREHIAPIAQRLQWLVQISEGLAVAHDAGIIHRDLKTENILINKRGQAKITDLGIAKSQDFNATLTDHVAGSYCSMSPEQAMGEAITFKSDLFSLGILAYQLLCGAHPFGDTNNKLQTMQRIITHPPTSPQQHNPDLPAEFIDLLGQLLSKDPDKRPDNTHWVATQFSKLKELNWKEDLPNDDTQAIPLSANTKASRTQDHPTFDTRFVAVAATPKISLWQKLKHYITANKIVVSSAAASFLILAGVVIWQLQPKPPKYVAVIPPKLTAEGMQESQQELVKEAVYDAIQQSIVQLDNYYLIPSSEIISINADEKTLLQATAADEVISSDIFCKIESCSITLSRSDKENSQRLKIKNTKRLDVLTDNYLSLSGTVQTQINDFYAATNLNDFKSIDEKDYFLFLNLNAKYRKEGATASLINSLDKLHKKTKLLPAVQTLYKEVALDLYQQTKNSEYLTRLENILDLRPTKNPTVSDLYNRSRLQIDKGDFNEAEHTIEQLKLINASSAVLYELLGHTMMARNNYSAAVDNYQRSVQSKKTADNLFNIANAYWYQGDTSKAKNYINQSLELAPSFHKSLSALGLIELIDGNIEQASIAFKNALIQKPDDIANLSNLGLCHLLNKEYQLAEPIFEKVAKLAPNVSTVKLNLADTKNLAGNVADANILYREIANTHNTPGDEALRNKAQAYAHLGDIKDSLVNLQELEKRDPQNQETIYTAALVHTLANNNSSAVLNIENAMKGGMHRIWFSFSWFDKLCSDNNFINLMREHGEPNRCALQQTHQN